NVLRCPKCYQDKVIPFSEKLKRCECGGKYDELLYHLIRKGKVRERLPSPQKIRKYVLRELENYAL
ncbi:MAG: nicotinate phosphoribosyltransferase, partial [Thermodesulfobacteriota bacterium]